MKKQIIRVKCTCVCHTDGNIVHTRACCNNGWIEKEIIVEDIKIVKIKDENKDKED